MASDYDALIFCWAGLMFPMVVGVWYCGGAAQFFDTIMEGFHILWDWFTGLV